MSDSLSNNRHEGGMESPSAYASAESSPAQSMVTSLSMQSMQSQQQQHQYDECSPTRSGTMPVSQSMSCFASSQTSSSAHHINLSTIPSSMSVSDIDTLAKLEELNMQAFTSLPPVTNSPKSGETVKAVIERTVKAELEKQQQTSPKISPSRSSVFSMLGRIFKSASKSTIDEKPKGGSVSPTSSTASSSSPNPESSPFKLLERPQMNEDLEQLRKQEISEAIKDEKVNEEPIEKLNEEKSSTQPQIVDNQEPKSVEVESQSKAEPQVELLQASENMKVPASSQEFCMDLNLNIAASVALAAAVPVAICEQATKKANHASSDDHQRFTKNASTSSIHNDLKAILEESKESSNGAESGVPSKKSKDAANTSSSSSKKKSSSSKKKSSSSSLTAAAAAEASDDANKTTSTTAGAETSITSPSKSEKRERKHRSKQSKSSEKKSSKSAKSPESSQLNVLEMLMKTAMEAAVATTTTTTTTTTVTAARQTAVKETISPVKQQQQQRNSHRYSRELLLRIRDERAKLIDNCCPDIFRTHAYCISGAFWDPEKYFNAILHGERLHDFVNNNHSDATVLNANTKAVNLSVSSASSLPYSKPYKHSPQQQHYKMSPRNNFNNNKPHWTKTNKPQLNRSQNGDELLQSLMSTKSESAGLELLDMLKRGNSTTSPKQGIDLMDMLNKKPNPPRQQAPLVLTAQELEFNQLFNKKQSVSPSSGSSPSLSTSLSPTSNGVVKSITEGDLSLLNSSDAYKQLVKNLNNHPLSRSDKTTVDDLFNSVIAQKKVEEEKESSNVLKQLLHLNLSEQKPNRINNKYNYYNRNQRQFKPTSKSSSTYARRSHNSSFNNEANLEDLILNKLKYNSPESQTNKNEQEHFKMLLDKLVVATSSSSSSKPDDIMKWFRTSTAAQNTTF